MRVLGIDPGIGRTGWGLIDKIGSRVAVVAYDCIETSKDVVLPERILTVHTKITQIIAEFHPDALAVEELFFNTNATTALIVGQARGVVLLAAAEAKLPVVSYTPLSVKIAVTGYGKADKRQVGQMVKTLLRLQTLPKLDDTTDALAIALTHAFSYKVSA